MPVSPLWRPTVIEGCGLRIRTACHAKNRRNGWISTQASRSIHEDLVANPNFNRKNSAALNLGKQCLDLLESWSKVPIEEGGSAIAAIVPLPLASPETQEFEVFEEGLL